MNRRMKGMVVALPTLLAVAACSDGPLGPAAGGRRPAPPQYQSSLMELAAEVSQALRNPDVRAWMLGEIAHSPYVEYRIPLYDVLSASASSRSSLIAGNADGKWAVMRNVLPDLELYFPFTEHRLLWNGEPAVQVAVPVGDSIAIFDEGGGHRIVSTKYRPAVPTLLLARTEIDYRVPESALRGGLLTGPSNRVDRPWIRIFNQECQEDCGGGGGGGQNPWGGITSNHTYLTHIKITENHDPFRGSMEIETFGRVNGFYAACARVTDIEEDEEYFYNTSNPSMVIATAIPASGHTVFVDIWEDDNDGCVLHTDDDDSIGSGYHPLSEYDIIWGSGHAFYRVSSGPAN